MDCQRVWHRYNQGARRVHLEPVPGTRKALQPFAQCEADGEGEKRTRKTLVCFGILTRAWPIRVEAKAISEKTVHGDDLLLADASIHRCRVAV
jgi:hypothetical protein